VIGGVTIERRRVHALHRRVQGRQGEERHDRDEQDERNEERSAGLGRQHQDPGADDREPEVAGADQLDDDPADQADTLLERAQQQSDRGGDARVTEDATAAPTSALLKNSVTKYATI